MLPVSLNPYALYMKAAVIGLVLISLIGMGLYIKYQSGTIETLETKLSTSENNVKMLNAQIVGQNQSIAASNAKYEEVQQQLNAANSLNKTLANKFGELKDDLKNKPIPRTCEEANQEMIQHGKDLGKLWKR